jgi:hypothetical protein
MEYKMSIQRVPNRGSLLSLEKEFSAYHLLEEVDVNQRTNFDYTEPNEGSPERIEPHLNLVKQREQSGVFGTTGGERSFFAALFADKAWCEGVVSIDITPAIKAYVDFNTMLIRISKNADEYAALSASVGDDISFEHRIEIIRDKIKEIKLPKKLKTTT